jgi:hypothetical protein
MEISSQPNTNCHCSLATNRRLRTSTDWRQSHCQLLKDWRLIDYLILAPSPWGSRPDFSGLSLMNMLAFVKVMFRPTVSLFWCQAPIWGPKSDLYCCLRVRDLLMWGALSDEGTGLSFIIAAGPRQPSHSGSESREAHDHVLLSQIRDSPNLQGPGPQWQGDPGIPPRHRVPLSSPPTTRQGCGGSIRTCLCSGYWPIFPIGCRRGPRRKLHF